MEIIYVSSLLDNYASFSVTPEQKCARSHLLGEGVLSSIEYSCIDLPKLSSCIMKRICFVFLEPLEEFYHPLGWGHVTV